jgi:hypothetical protein
MDNGKGREKLGGKMKKAISKVYLTTFCLSSPLDRNGAFLYTLVDIRNIIICSPPDYRKVSGGVIFL